MSPLTLFGSASSQHRVVRGRNKWTLSRALLLFLVNKLEDATYETLHTQACAEVDCKIIESPVQALCGILNDGIIPIMRFMEEAGARLAIEIFIFGDKRDNNTYYTAISMCGLVVWEIAK
ncbi:hypothetical protein F5B19DRAFT_499386 [Rostrohypoxylon terebratum]|nr:hypothetical protein F5B19DRAFT_499386 [Rostrohypoxylon terebratum]